MAKKKNNKPKTTRAPTKIPRASTKRTDKPKTKPRTSRPRAASRRLAALGPPNAMQILVPQIQVAQQQNGSFIVTVPVAFNPAISEVAGVITAASPSISSRFMNTTIADSTQDLTANGAPNLPQGGRQALAPGP